MTAAMLACAAPAAAVTVFNESSLPGGDFQDFRTFGPGADIVTLADGANQIVGNLTGTCSNGICATQIQGAGAGPGDFFKFDFGAQSTVVTDLSVLVTNVSAPVNFVPRLAAMSDDPASNAFLIENLTEGVASTGTIFGNSTQSGVFGIFFGVIGATASADGSFSFDWTMNIEVSQPSTSAPVPAPAPLALIALGCAAVVLNRRRARQLG